VAEADKHDDFADRVGGFLERLRAVAELARAGALSPAQRTQLNQLRQVAMLLDLQAAQLIDDLCTIN
jgi:hypothetical protein